MFIDESKICIGAGYDTEKFTWMLQSERESENCSNFSRKFHDSIIFLDWRSSKKQCVVNGDGNLDNLLSILDDFLIPSSENQFRDSEVIFMHDNVSCDTSPDREKFSVWK